MIIIFHNITIAMPLLEPCILHHFARASGGKKKRPRLYSSDFLLSLLETQYSSNDKGGMKVGAMLVRWTLGFFPMPLHPLGGIPCHSTPSNQELGPTSRKTLDGEDLFMNSMTLI